MPKTHPPILRRWRKSSSPPLEKRPQPGSLGRPDRSRRGVPIRVLGVSASGYHAWPQLDVWRRRINGWAMATHLRTSLVLAALDMAIAQRRPTAVIHPSDQGCQYPALEFGRR